MLDYLQCSPSYASHSLPLPFPDPAQKYPFPTLPAQPFSPASSTFTFDPFAEDDDSASSAASHAPAPETFYRTRSSSGDSQRGAKVEFLREQWMRRVTAWVEGVHSGLIPLTCPRTQIPSTRSTALRSPTSSASPEPAVWPHGALSDEEEPYIIYSTPRPGEPLKAPVPAQRGPAPAAPIAPPRTPSGRHVHSRVPSLDSIREEDEREELGARV
ncbi:hypothetical protein EVG20_g10983 [Dentipellis fragilis]|uniref:Uncharacterized protein n=1 Tax=Dentipellis fragilis TaxID=205917 RepID=A0A4Y9XQ49_9AGAM|nr:hypothetical protein EVG20_g10983 [Dentipellis fragilis]